MERTIFCISAVIATLVIALGHCPLRAQTAPLAASPKRVQISVVFLEVSPAIMDKLDRDIPDGDTKAARILDAICTSQTPDLTTLSLQTSNDFPGIASTLETVSFSDKDHPGKNYVTLEKSLEVTPHIDGDIITVKLKAMDDVPGSAGLPQFVGHGITLPLYYLKSGVMAMLPGVPLTSTGKPIERDNSRAMECVTFVTANILPASVNSTMGGK